MIIDQIKRFLDDANKHNFQIDAIGISVPGIYHEKSGSVWANNIRGWDHYPLYDDIAGLVNNQGITIFIDNDRACCILGEIWMGKARGCSDVIFLLVGTGIGAGIMANGQIVRGFSGAAGAAGWLALNHPFSTHYIPCGCFEYHASGNGLVKVLRDYIRTDNSYNGNLKAKLKGKITSKDIFSAFVEGDPLAIRILNEAIEYWGMAIANLVSLFNPEKIILGGGLFGPGLQFVSAIFEEAKKWAQPVSISHVRLEGSALGTDAALYGAGYLALKSFAKT